jgi:hypothetical protein
VKYTEVPEVRELISFVSRVFYFLVSNSIPILPHFRGLLLPVVSVLIVSATLRLKFVYIMQRVCLNAFVL